jgi:hypothetical protein
MTPNSSTYSTPFDWDTPLDPAKKAEILTKIADTVIARGLQTPVILFLEIHRPLAPLGAQIGITLSPFIAVWLKDGAFDMQHYTQLLRDPANITELIDLIETREKHTP